jgi:hypothetical protein
MDFCYFNFTFCNWKRAGHNSTELPATDVELLATNVITLFAAACYWSFQSFTLLLYHAYWFTHFRHHSSDNDE